MTKVHGSPIHAAALGVATSLGRSLQAGKLRAESARLEEAIFNDDLAGLQELLEAGVSPDLPFPGRPLTALGVAAGRGQVALVQALIQAGADLNRPMPGYGTPLSFALASDQTAVVDLLLEAGADPNAHAPGISPPLLIALTERHESTLRRLLDAGADPNATDAEGWPALRVALDLDLEPLARLLAEHGARGDAPCPDGWNALLTALHCMQEDLALHLMEVPLNATAFQGPDGATALDLAASGGLLRALDRLLALGHPVDGSGTGGPTPLLRAILFGQPEAVDRLLAAGATLARPEGLTPNALLSAAFLGFPQVLAAAQSQGISLDQPELIRAAGSGGLTSTLDWLQSHGIALTAGSTAMNHAWDGALSMARPEALRWMLEKGVDACLPDASGVHPLVKLLAEEATPTEDRVTEDLTPVERRLEALAVLVAAGANPAVLSETPGFLESLLRHGRARVVVDLFERGLPLPSPDTHALHLAAFHSLDLVRYLLERGLNAQDVEPEHGTTPLWLAAAKGRGDILEVLLEAGASVDAPDHQGVTPLMVAASAGAKEAVELLLKHGAHANAQDASGWSALMLATETGHASTVQLLLKHGAKRTLKNKDQATALTLARKARRKDLMKLLG